MISWFSVLLIFFLGATTFEELYNQFLECSQVSSDEKRLKCFDASLLNNTLKPKSTYIQPSSAFFESELRVKQNHSDFKLTVMQFVKLLKTAKLDGGQEIKLYGWKRSNQGYVLNIGMRTPTRLVFNYSAQSSPNYCVLEPVTVDGAEVDPSLFVLNIAAMTPD